MNEYKILKLKNRVVERKLSGLYYIIIYLYSLKIYLMYIQKKAILIASSMLLIIASFAQSNKITASRRGGSEHKMGVGINYSYPAAGISARFKVADQIKVQGTFSYKNYGTYSWNVIGAEVNYIFKESNTGIGQIDPFGYASFGRGTIKFTDPLLQSLIKENFHWYGWNIGAGAEWFPEILDERIGIIAKLGFGSYGTYGLSTGVRSGLLYGGGIHYYFN